MYSDELREAYQKTISAFVDAYPKADDDLTIQLDNYSRACALNLWHKLGVEAENCVDPINHIYSDGIAKKELTISNIEMAMQRLSSNSHVMPVPNFYYGIVEYDRKNNTDYSRKLLVCFEILNVIYAMIDDVFEEKEADIISVMLIDLKKLCDDNDISDDVEQVNIQSYIKRDEEKLNVTFGGKKGKNGRAVGIKDRGDQQDHHDDSQVVIEEKKDEQAGYLELDSLIGLSNVKQEINSVCNFAKIQKERRKQGLPVSDVSYHLVFTGNPGTGKTTVARIVSGIYKDLGIISKGHLTEVSAKDLVAGYVGQTAIKTGEVIEKALGGVLFIDEAYTLVDKSGQGFGQEAIDTLLKEMEDKRNDLIVIVAGYDDLMRKFIKSNPGLESRFNRFIHFDDYKPDQMYEIFEGICQKGAYVLTEDAADIVKKYLTTMYNGRDESFANGRSVRNFFESLITKQAGRIATSGIVTKEALSTITKEDIEGCVGKVEDEECTLDGVLNDLKELIGLEMVKEEISELLYIVQNRQRRKAQGLKVPDMSHHLVFMGNPGTGKTTVARMVAKIYKCLGLLSKGQMIETDRSGLVAGYVGQTAIKTKEVINSAIGGVLFIDEAYTLASDGANDFGQEAIDTLLKEMEDHRDDLVVIVAGYDEDMEGFISSNPGLESRFNRYIHFEDYSSDQMVCIFENLCSKNQYVLTESAAEKLKLYFDSCDMSAIGNGRGARNAFERVVTQQAKRIERMSDSPEMDLQAITEDDINAALTRDNR